jgi:serine/threonine protein kinase
MSPFWKRLAGLRVADRYRLKQILGGDDAAAFFLAAVDPDGEVVIKITTEDAAEQLAFWERLRQLSHPNLIPLLDCGAVEIDGDRFVYAAFEYPEESAATALERAPMSGDDAREVLRAVAGALEYLHANGLVHTAVAPDHIVAVGDRVKLTSETVREASPKHSAQSDVWDLGATVYELMTRRRIARGDELDLTRIEEPFRSIVQQALTGAASLSWMVEALDAPPPHVEAVSPARPASPPTPIVEPPPAAAEPRHTPKWPWVAAAAVVLVGVLAFNQKSEREPQAASYVSPTAAPARGVAPPRPSAPAPAGVTAPPRPSAPAPAPIGATARPRPSERAASLPPASAPPRSPSPAPARVNAPPSRSERVIATRDDPRPFWRVIAYQYSRVREAEVKAHRINQQWPEFHASVFAPMGRDRAPYLVALGGRMSKPDAARLQQKARARGLPRDTFVRNYAE